MKNELLAKYILGEANTKEGQRVEQWLEESEDHQREFRQLKRRIELGSKRYKYGVFDPRQAIQKVKFPAKTHYLRILPVAASIIVLIFGVLWFWNKSSLQETVLLSRTGETKVFYLPDSSRVMLSGDSRLAYNAQFGKTNRELSLRGEAFFQVKRDTSKPFIVETSLIQVEVLGTSFQVIAEKLQAEVFVEKGRVKIITQDKKQERILETGMSVKYGKKDRKLMISTKEDKGEQQILKFDNAPLSEVIETLNEYYDSHVTLPADYATLRITVVFKEVSLEEAIEIINRTLDIQLTI
ncbi:MULTISPECIES: FecR domain-containing protein [Butyricimonas]|uniref:FecR domain-containing protein n=1 Tax=Butyricimonas TaxID=574697 RepID=UPI0020853D7D|nr:FecR domain-containing protein [Butyricimonas paravirosa]BDF53707.1 anti-sigma factor [Odoribacteraceae bacterium]GKH92646.1 anti-sigma factor [Odoribacteraceae bacterium]GKI00532.1 anti-sigma factor [Odoribacteraceae bacterium]GKI05155.1 anti-sigma factor [Odoribacteraceae bacterium]